jgi:leucyl aminopeptidase
VISIQFFILAAEALIQFNQMIIQHSKNVKGSSVTLLQQTDKSYLTSLSIPPDHISIIHQQLHSSNSSIILYQEGIPQWYLWCSSQSEESLQAEAIRKMGAQILPTIKLHKVATLTVINHTTLANATIHCIEGLALANYQFLKYKTKNKTLASSLKEIYCLKEAVSATDLKRLQIIVAAITHVRDLVNEPLSYLTAEQLAEDISALGKDAGFRVTVLDKAKIAQQGMGGLLAVNKGSILPPTFTIMEHRPTQYINKAPIVLVGKGIVYDTGGLSLKPTPNSMDRMKSDMSGAALVTGVLYAVAQLNLPLYVIGLIPATDNRPGENAYVPGDVITMMSGTTVEVLNTDAEGRLVLADALHYAKKYKPELVLDFATLTGAASAAIGDVAMVTMGTAGDNIKQHISQSGWRQYERTVELPLWSEYGDMIKSDIADLKNIGGATGGAITAGKFLEHFTEYPWMHFDIAGVSHFTTAKNYFTAGGTAFGLRMMVDFLTQYAQRKVI